MQGLLLTLVLALPAAGPPEGYNKAYDILMAAKVQAYYSHMKDFKASFVQTYVKRYHGEQKPRYGYVWIKKPGKMYWRYDSPRKRAFVSDGKKIYLYDAARKQLIWRTIRLDQLPSATKFLWGSSKILDEFYVKVLPHSKYGGPGKVVLKLLPKKRSPNFSHILFVLNPKGRQAEVTETIVYDVLGNKNRYRFKHPVINSNIPDSRFAFKAPAHTRVIQATDKTRIKP